LTHLKRGPLCFILWRFTALALNVRYPLGYQLECLKGK
jgi:hypothetical protein